MNSVSKRQSEERGLGCVLSGDNKEEAVCSTNGTRECRKQSGEESLQRQGRVGARDRPVRQRKWAREPWEIGHWFSFLFFNVMNEDDAQPGLF